MFDGIIVGGLSKVLLARLARLERRAKGEDEEEKGRKIARLGLARRGERWAKRLSR